jgi:hypothetical protein
MVGLSWLNTVELRVLLWGLSELKLKPIACE